MTIKTILIVGATAALGLTACTKETNYFTTWNQEAGAFLDVGTFGNATARNMMLQMCGGVAKGTIIYEPVVVEHPTSTPTRPVYSHGHVQCGGILNGKYAQVIFREYVRSATPTVVVESGQLGDTGG